MSERGKQYVKGYNAPDQKPLRPGLNQQCASEYNPVHQPWCQLGGVRCLERLVRCEQWEEEGRDGANTVISSCPQGYSRLLLANMCADSYRQWMTYDRILAKMSNMMYHDKGGALEID
jgi:hypothetical protein